MQQITEKMGIHKDWYKEARGMTLEKMPEFLRHLSEDYDHDYGTICHALSASAIAATWAMDRSPQGGITGFQAGCIMWGFVQHWMHYENEPLRLIRYNDMLYPQHLDKFLGISKETWAWLQEKAKKELHRILIRQRFGSREILFRRFDMFGGHYGVPMVHPHVFAHWKTIVRGEIPFGCFITS